MKDNEVRNQVRQAFNSARSGDTISATDKLSLLGALVRLGKIPLDLFVRVSWGVYHIIFSKQDNDSEQFKK